MRSERSGSNARTLRDRYTHGLWFKEVEQADWSTPAQAKDQFPRASTVRDNRVAFDVGGNRFRLVVWANYRRRAVCIEWSGNHAEYDRLGVEKVGL